MSRQPNGIAHSGTRILVVDDARAMCNLIADGLRDHGHQVSTASDGGEAMRLLQLPRSPDVIVTDLAMPQVDGLALIAFSKQHHPQIPIVVVTGLRDDNLHRRAYDLGAAKVLHKPIRITHLRDAIDSLLRAA